MEKIKFLTFNFLEKEQENLKALLNKINIDYELENTLEVEDIIGIPSYFAIINLRDKSEFINEINDILKYIREYQKYIIIDDYNTENEDKILKFLEDNYDDCINHKIYRDEKRIKDTILGFAIGDALGVPVEFKSRNELLEKPVTDMMGNGTYNMPKGTWSDDTSMTLATMYSIISTKQIDTNNIAENFLDWLKNGNYTATGKTFDVGNTTFRALNEFEVGVNTAENCGQSQEMDNGNGSLMRMIPIAYYIQKKGITEEREIFDIVKKVSSITHAHEISILGCYIYVRFLLEILDEKYKDKAYENILSMDYSFFSKESIDKYSRILNGGIKKYSQKDIKSTGYVVYTLEAVLWLFLNAKDYNSAILEAVNLGDDTDTVAAITGGLLGVYYGLESINENWKKSLLKLDYILEVCDDFEDTLDKRG